MISIVIPYLSGLANLKNCLKSIKQQSVDCEVIVVNDSKKKLGIEDVIIINNEKTFGAAYSRNIGFKKSNYEEVLFVDCDIVLQSHCIKKMLKEIKHFDVVFPRILYSNRRLMHPVGDEQSFPQISACFIIKKNSARKLDELFDENYKIYLEDADFFLRSKLLGLKINYVSDAKVIHKLKQGYNKRRFYLENRNLVYGLIKFSGVNKNNIYHPFHFFSLLKNLVCAIFNFDKFDWSHYNRNMSEFEKFKLLFKKHKKLSFNRLTFIYYFFKGVFWNFINIKIVLGKKRTFKNFNK